MYIRKSQSPELRTESFSSSSWKGNKSWISKGTEIPKSFFSLVFEFISFYVLFDVYLNSFNIYALVNTSSSPSHSPGVNFSLINPYAMTDEVSIVSLSHKYNINIRNASHTRVYWALFHCNVYPLCKNNVIFPFKLKIYL